MASDPRFDVEYDRPDAPREKKSGWSNCLIGCLIVFVIAVVFFVVLGIWVSRNWRDWAATAGAEGVKHVIDASELPQQEKAEINVEVDRVAEEFRAGRMSAEQMGVLMQKLFESPLMTSLVVYGVEKQYLDRSGLSEEEKTEGRRTIRRFMRGVIDQKIDEQSTNSVLDHIGDRDDDGNWQMRERVTDEELRAFLAEAKSRADQAEIPDEPEDIDPSDEFKRIIDETLNPPPGVPPLEQP